MFELLEDIEKMMLGRWSNYLEGHRSGHRSSFSLCNISNYGLGAAVKSN